MSPVGILVLEFVGSVCHCSKCDCCKAGFLCVKLVAACSSVKGFQMECP